ncbi:diacylglycerol pyrophosphate phosphatase [Aspergillus sclerotioniger CBS 115572]|uniref:Diacylglycerol pyrophosphate phosphatase n=1 Tax=Aspergillus sclerotioniger CBS 115572 TaxID=1450535 RepID=A0A317WT88_9EURO|nr:diacylglycerol pyrophosphate phosphatase [Aspergillus sclerotioniger CBS 115572]PWY89623.1 diacylglycerol pyrophosphate phosphatase [Aspergillus sclerotioniger CBS 115572]
MASTPQDNGGFGLLSGEPKRTSKRVVCSYVLDWVFIILLAIIGAILYKITGSEHAFSLDDASISYPLKTDTVSIVIVGIIACAVPAILIVLICLLTPGPWSRRLWEWHAGWLGLALSLAGAFFLTSGLKDVVGKPRPDLLARCQPDMTNITAYAVGGLGLQREESPILVTSAICQNADSAIIKAGFAAFPSGHSSFSWAGLLYLSLWLGAKFSVSIPIRSMFSVGGPTKSSHNRASAVAAPPLYLLVLIAVPVGGAFYICASRYMDYMHAGWDILGGSLIGIGFAILGFLWYHAPAGQGYGGWAWGARSSTRAFGTGFGSEGSGSGVETRASTTRDGYEDLELGAMNGSQGMLRVANP